MISYLYFFYTLLFSAWKENQKPVKTVQKPSFYDAM